MIDDQSVYEHVQAWGDTGDGYTATRGWRVACLWCDYETFAVKHDDAVAKYRAEHEKPIQDRSVQS